MSGLNKGAYTVSVNYCVPVYANHNLFQLRYWYCTQVFTEQLPFTLTQIFTSTEQRKYLKNI